MKHEALQAKLRTFNAKMMVPSSQSISPNKVNAGLVEPPDFEPLAVQQPLGDQSIYN